MKHSVPSVTHQMTLQEVIAQIRDHPSVSGIVIVGSLSRGVLGPTSDYDLLLVLDSMPVPLHVAYTTIDRRMTDVIFVDAKSIERLERSTTRVPVDGSDGALMRWLQSGEIVFDRQGTLSRVQQAVRLRRESEPSSFSAKYGAWFSINYNLSHNKRMLRSDDPVYLMALDLRLLYSVFDVLLAYLRLRDVPWKGEKEAVRFLAAHDAAFLALLRACLAETNRSRKLELYEQLAARTVEPIGELWLEDATAVQFDQDTDLTPRLLEDGLTFWHELVSGRVEAGPNFLAPDD